MKNILLLTNSFPYGVGEEFIETEINFLSKEFKVTIIPFNSNSENCRILPQNVDVFNGISKGWKNKRAISFILAQVNTFWIYKKEFFKSIKNLRDLKLYFIYTWTAWIFYKNCKNIVKNRNTIIYSYWLNQNLLAIDFFEKRNKWKLKKIARAHGYDLFSERRVSNNIPFQEKLINELDYLFLVSNHGLSYLKEKYPQYIKKYILSYLGVDKIENAKIKNEKIDLVSCSSLIPLKRVDLIIESLSLIKENVSWRHIGTGPEFNKLNEYCLKKLQKNIDYKFLGHIENQKVKEFLGKNKIKFFITLTETEGGVPVSIQEAMSCGIPVIGTKVGGVPEIVNADNGILVDCDCDKEELSNIINNALNIENEKYEKMCVNAYKSWEIGFNSNKNYSYFIDIINKLLNL